MGAAGNFMAQMECFAVANLFISLFFLHRLFQTGKASVKNFSAILTKKRIAYLTVTGICVAATFLMVMVSIVPEVPAGVGYDLYTGDRHPITWACHVRESQDEKRHITEEKAPADLESPSIGMQTM